MVQSMDSTVEKSSGCRCGSHNPPSMLVQQQLHFVMSSYDTIRPLIVTPWNTVVPRIFKHLFHRL